MIPLILSGREQDFLAEVCQVLHNPLYQAGGKTPVPAAKVWEELQDTCERFDVDPTKLSDLYDRFHRSGANA